MHLVTKLKIHEQKLTEMKGEKDTLAITVGNFRTPFSVIDRITRQKIVRLEMISATPYNTMIFQHNTVPLHFTTVAWSIHRAHGMLMKLDHTLA